jgi:hypothetical protein
MDRLTPVPEKSADFNLLRWSVQALQTKSNEQQTHDASTTRVSLRVRMVLTMAAVASGVQAAERISTWRTFSREVI